MKLYSIIFGAFLELIILQTARAYIPGCHFLETVNITSSQSFENGSYIFEDIEVPAFLTGQYKYITTENGIYESTKSHLRGCVCRLKPCIWICCRYKDWDPSNGKCTDGLMEDLREINPFLNVILSNGSVVKKNLLKDIIVLRDRMRFSDSWEKTEYKLFENGGLLINSYLKGFDCFHPNQFTSDSTESFVAAQHTALYYQLQRPHDPIDRTLKWLSQVFLVLTIAVYLCVKKLRNLHGKCFICYMITSILYENNEYDTIVLQLCVLQGCCVHFILIAKFSWLLALSHQLWRGLTLVNRDESEYSFGAYSIFAWGTPAVLIGITFLIHRIWDSDPNMVEWVPGMGWEECYLKYRVSHFGYTFLPITILVALNTILFLWTIISIVRVKLLLRHLSDYHERKHILNSRMQMFYLFLRLSIVMDIQWSVLVVSIYARWNLLFLICYYCHSCLGIIIFVLFVLKRSTLKLLMESIRSRRK